MTDRRKEPDFQEAQAFLNLLESGGQFTYQTFDDDDDRRMRNKQEKGFDPYAKIYHGELLSCGQSLKALNQHGAGIFVTVNETNLKGRKTSDILRVRALFLDLDGAPLEPVLEISRAANILPHIVTESSAGRFHIYWIVKDVRLEDFDSYQKALIKRFGGDPVIHDLPRVMRLPGFWHQKDPTKPFMTHIVEVLNA